MKHYKRLQNDIIRNKGTETKRIKPKTAKKSKVFVLIFNKLAKAKKISKMFHFCYK